MVLFADFSFAGALSLFAVLLGAMALAKPKRMKSFIRASVCLNSLILALPMMLCLFIMGILLVHGWKHFTFVPYMPACVYKHLSHRPRFYTEVCGYSDVSSYFYFPVQRRYANSKFISSLFFIIVATECLANHLPFHIFLAPWLRVLRMLLRQWNIFTISTVLPVDQIRWQ